MAENGGITAPITYTAADHGGPTVHKVIGWDYAAGKVKNFGGFKDYEKYIK